MSEGLPSAATTIAATAVKVTIPTTRSLKRVNASRAQVLTRARLSVSLIEVVCAVILFAAIHLSICYFTAPQ